LLQAELQMPECLLAERGSYHIHPALMDVCYQSLVDLFQHDIETGNGLALLPIKAGRLDVYRNSSPTTCRGRLLRRSRRSVLADFELLDAEGDLVARLSACRFRAAPLTHKAQEQISTWQIVPVLQPHFAEPAETPIPAIPDMLKPHRLIEEAA